MRYPACFLDDKAKVLFSNSSANAHGVFRSDTSIFESLPHSSSHILEALIEDSFNSNREKSGQFRWASGQTFADFLMTVTPVSVHNRQVVFVTIHELAQYAEAKAAEVVSEIDRKPMAAEPLNPPDQTIESWPAGNNEKEKVDKELRTLHRLLDHSGESIIRMGQDFKITDVNKTAANQSKLLARGNHFLKAVRTEDQTKVQKILEQVLVSGKAATFRSSGAENDTKYSTFHNHAFVSMDSSSDTELVVISTDITEHIQLENKFEGLLGQMEEKNAILSALLEHSPAPIFIEDLEGAVLIVNEAALKLTDKPRKNVLGRKHRELFNSAIADSLRKDSKDVIGSKDPVTCEKTVEGPDDQQTYLVSKFPLANGDGTTFAVGSIWVDLTEQQRALCSEKTQRALCEASKDLLAYWNLNGKPLFVNRTCVEGFGWTTSVPSIADFVTPTAAQKLFKEILPEVRKSGKAWEGRSEVVKKATGEVIPVWQKIFVVTDNADQPLYFAMTAVDLTERIGAQMALSQAAKLSSLGSMAGGIAQEINNPLAIIYGKSCQIRKLAARGDISPAELVSELEKVEQTALRISRIIKGLRSFARNGDQDPLVDVPVNNIIDETLTFCQERFRNHGIDLTIARLPDHAVNCRAIQISQVLLNLLNNAFDAVEPLQQRWVDLQMEEEDGRINISVVDSGMGIAPRIVERMMDPFFTTKEPGRGTGLGLSISKGVIEEHGGSLYYSPLDGHTRFVLTLPAKKLNGKKAAA